MFSSKVDRALRRQSRCTGAVRVWFGTVADERWRTIDAELSAYGAGCGTKAIHYQLRHEYAVTDPQFPQTMGNLLGPARQGTRAAACAGCCRTALR